MNERLGIPLPDPQSRPFIYPHATLQDVRQEHEDTLRLIDRATARRPVSIEQLHDYVSRQYVWLDRLADQIARMEAGDVA